MTARFRLLAVALLSYVVADLTDPSIPGVFFFDSDQLFLDGVVSVKTSAPAMKSSATDPADGVAPDTHTGSCRSMTVRVADDVCGVRRDRRPPPLRPAIFDVPSSDDDPAVTSARAPLH